MKNFPFNKIIFLSTAAFFLAACQPPTTTTNGVNTNQTIARADNSNTGNSSLNLGNSSGNTNSANIAGSGDSNAAPGTAIEASEPQMYQAVVALTLQAGGDGKMPSLPKITAQVARSGDNRRMEFNMPNGEKVVYLDLGGKQFIVSPQRKQYGELNKESLGFDVRRLLMPSQIVAQVKAQKGVERIGEEKYAGREAVKYGYSGVTDTKSKAGNVSTQSVIYVDKETGLPLHSETVSESENGSGVNGVKSLRLVTEMTNLQTNADANLFKEPTDFQKVPPEQIRQQVDLIFNAAAVFLAQALKTPTAANPSPTAAP